MPAFVRTSTVTAAVSSLQCVTRMPALNGSLPHASAAGHAGSPSAFGGNAGDRIAATTAGACIGGTVCTRAAGWLADPGPQAIVVAAAAPTTIAGIQTCTRSPSHPSPTQVKYPFTSASIL